MGRGKLIAGLFVVALAVPACWQIASCELSNLALQDDLKDLSAQGGTRIGLLPPKSDTELQDAVIQKARSHEILLVPEQITVQRKDSSGDFQTIYLAVDYKQRVNLPGFSFPLHFRAASAR
jgi:hypothetical protein